MIQPGNGRYTWSYDLTGRYFVLGVCKLWTRNADFPPHSDFHV